MRETKFKDLKDYGYYLVFQPATDDVVQFPDDREYIRRNILWFENESDAKDAMYMMEYTLWLMTEFDEAQTRGMLSIYTPSELIDELNSNFQFHIDACYPPELAHTSLQDWFDNGKKDSCDRIGLEFFNLGKEIV